MPINSLRAISNSLFFAASAAAALSDADDELDEDEPEDEADDDVDDDVDDAAVDEASDWPAASSEIVDAVSQAASKKVAAKSDKIGLNIWCS